MKVMKRAVPAVEQEDIDLEGDSSPQLSMWMKLKIQKIGINTCNFIISMIRFLGTKPILTN